MSTLMSSLVACSKDPIWEDSVLLPSIETVTVRPLKLRSVFLPRRYRTKTQRTQDVQKTPRPSSECLTYVQCTSCVYGGSWVCNNFEFHLWTKFISCSEFGSPV